MGVKSKGVITSVFGLATLLCIPLGTVAQLPPQEELPPEELPEELIIPPTSPDPIEPTIPQPSAPSPLPDEFPEATPEPNLQSPSPSRVPGCPAPPETSDRFFVRQVEVVGNTVLQTEIDQYTQPLKRRTVTLEDLLCLRSKITELYIQNGYVTSGAFLPNNQDLSDGIVQIQVVEGELNDIEISGLNRLQTGYVRSRLRQATTAPLNQQRLEEALQLLQLDSLIDQVNAELTVGSTPGQNTLLIDLQEASAFNVGVGSDNYRSPSIGSAQLNVLVAHDNLLGVGDRLSAQYGLTEGLDIYDIGYAVPVNANDGTLGVRYSNSDTTIIEDEFEEFEIESETETVSFSLRQPVLRSPQRELALGLTLDLRHRQTFLQGEPFSFDIGTEDGESEVTVLRFSQDWVERGASRVLAARSQLSFGLDAFGATVNDVGTDGRFFAWQGQFQWVQQLSSRTLLITRIGTQLTPDSLLSLEQFSIGGASTVRGYRENQLVTDNGVLGSIELRIPLTAAPSVLQLTPFFDIGTGWNNQAPDPETATLASLGLGVRWLITDNLGVRLDYGIPLIAVARRGDSLQDNGFHFSLDFQPF
ncbi:MAG: ShlB/FhaC/HecB family hemolysin secretion/activation protein [Cyanophyceae cyanobacterium]